MPAVEDRVKQIIVDQLGVEPSEVTPAASFVDDLGADSLDRVEVSSTGDEHRIDRWEHYLNGALVAADRERIAREGRATRRRMNRFEYENTLRDLLGIPVLELRDFLPEEGIDGKDHVVILMNKLWKRLGADPNIVGKQIMLDQKPYTVVGVLAGGQADRLNGRRLGTG